MLVGEALIEFLSEVGVTHLFGIPGYANLPLFALLEGSPLRTVLARHEEGAAFMAYGYAKATGRVAACAGTSGAGSIHLLAGVAAAYANSVPMVVVTGQVETWKWGRNAFQEMTGRGARGADVRQMFDSLTVYNGIVENIAELPLVFARVHAALEAPRKGPVHINIPVDILKSELPAGLNWRSVSVPVTRNPVPSASDLRAVKELLTKARAPMLLLGRGCSGAIGLAREFVASLGIPFATTIQGKGVADHDSPFCLGVAGVAGSPRANRWLFDECDVLVAVGTSLNEFTTGTFSLCGRRDLEIVRVDVDRETLLVPLVPRLPIWADASAFFGSFALAGEECELAGFAREQFEVMLAETPPWKPVEALLLAARKGATSRDEQARPGALEREAMRKGASARDTGPTARAALKPYEVVQILGEEAPPDAIFVADSGNNAIWAVHYLKLRGEQRFLIDINTGCMGSGVVSAIGAQMASPERPVIAICGDGAFFMLGSEVATAVDNRVPVIWIVLDDEKLGMVRQGLVLKYGIQGQCDFVHSNVARLAQAMGAATQVVDDARDFREALSRALGALRNGGGPMVLDVKFDDSVLPQVYDRAAAAPDDQVIAEILDARREVRSRETSARSGCEAKSDRA